MKSCRNNQRSYQDAHYEDEWKKNNVTMNSPCPSKETSATCSWVNSDHFPAAISDSAGVRLEEDQADARLG